MIKRKKKGRILIYEVDKHFDHVITKRRKSPRAKKWCLTNPKIKPFRVICNIYIKNSNKSFCIGMLSSGFFNTTTTIVKARSKRVVFHNLKVGDYVTRSNKIDEVHVISVETGKKIKLDCKDRKYTAMKPPYI